MRRFLPLLIAVAVLGGCALQKQPIDQAELHADWGYVPQCITTTTSLGSCLTCAMSTCQQADPECDFTSYIWLQERSYCYQRCSQNPLFCDEGSLTADFVPYCASHRTTYTACVECAEERAGEVCGVDPSGACRESIRQLETAWCLEMNP